MLNAMFRANWTEYEWEEAFREDDARISAYMKELPLFMDLPEEDEIMLTRLQTQYKLQVPELPWMESEDETLLAESLADDCADEEPEIYYPDGGDILQTVWRLSRSWCKINASKLSPSLYNEGAALICAYGIVLARLGDIIDEHTLDFPNLRTALAKRTLRYLSELIPMLSYIGEQQPSLSDEIAFQVMSVRDLCERTGMLIYKFRSDVNQKS